MPFEICWTFVFFSSLLFCALCVKMNNRAGSGQPVNGAIPSLPSPTMPTFNMAAQTPNGQPGGTEATVYTNGIPQSYPGREYTNELRLLLDEINRTFIYRFWCVFNLKILRLTMRLVCVCVCSRIKTGRSVIERRRNWSLLTHSKPYVCAIFAYERILTFNFTLNAFQPYH